MLTRTEGYNPDVLLCLANLSSDEVFTPPNLANAMLDMLPDELWRNPDAKFLDPCCKSGVFLREIAKRLDAGLEDQIPDRQERINHILKNQLFGIAITELTALLSRRSVYCSKTANGKYSVCELFEDEQGNILYERVEHTWRNGRCKYCGASQAAYERGESLETHAYKFIHTDDPKEIFKMEFDVIVGNPPYQLSDGGFGRSASPIYHRFVQQAKKLRPRFLTMIIPARWYAGGKGLEEFRREMLSDSALRTLVDFQNSSDVFPGVDVAGGICYFLWKRDEQGACEVVTVRGNERYSAVRALNEFHIFVRDSAAVPIVRKILSFRENGGRTLSHRVSPRNPFGVSAQVQPKDSGVPCWFMQRVGLRYVESGQVSDSHDLLDKWKLLVPRAPIAGQTDFSQPVTFYYKGNVRVARPGEVCTDTYIVAGAFPTRREVLSFKSYLLCKTVRFLLLQAVVSQDVTRENFCFVPDMERYDRIYTDKFLRERWAITEQEWGLIDSRIA